MGTMGTPVRVANMAAPALASTFSPSSTRVPSGKMSSLCPSFRQRRAVLAACMSAWPRSTPKMPALPSSQPITGTRISWILAITRRGFFF